MYLLECICVAHFRVPGLDFSQRILNTTWARCSLPRATGTDLHVELVSGRWALGLFFLV